MKLRTLKTRGEIEALASRGRRVSLTFEVIYFGCGPKAETRGNRLVALTDSAVAIQVSRMVGKAVHRNRIRRLVKEVCRQAFPRFQSEGQFLIIARTRALGAKFDDLRRELEQFFEDQGFLPAHEMAGVSER